MLKKVTGHACLTAVVALVAFGCRRHDEVPPATDAPAEARVAVTEKAALVFPESLRVDDPSVNEVLQRAMRLCTSGDYESFRGIWSAREQPLSEDKFDQMRLAVTQIEIRALERATLNRKQEHGPDLRETVYVAYARMQLDLERLPGSLREAERQPAGAEANPQREAVLMMVREFNQWRLAHAPQKMRKWLKQRIEPPTESPADRG